jgi:hypothetical protein
MMYEKEKKGHNKMNASIYCKKKQTKEQKKKVVTRDEEEKQTEDRAIFMDT